MSTGIHTLADLRGRCYIDPESGCWHWRGAISRNNGMAEPRLHLPVLGVTTTLQRAAWHLAGKAWPAPQPKVTVWRRCGCATCGNPSHLLAGTKAQWGRWVADKGHLRGRLERRIINRRNKLSSGQARITQELAQWIRESHQTGREVAHGLGVSVHIVSRVRTGRTWQPLAPAASVFSWRPQG